MLVKFILLYKQYLLIIFNSGHVRGKNPEHNFMYIHVFLTLDSFGTHFTYYFQQ